MHAQSRGSLKGACDYWPDDVTTKTAKALKQHFLKHGKTM